MFLNTNRKDSSPLKGRSTGAAWLSSARVLKRSLKWGNERNPHLALQVSQGTAQPKVYLNERCIVGWEEGADDVKSAWPFDTLGHTRATMASTMGREAVRRS